jgi:hypothetical protein
MNNTWDNFHTLADVPEPIANQIAIWELIMANACSKVKVSAWRGELKTDCNRSAVVGILGHSCSERVVALLVRELECWVVSMATQVPAEIVCNFRNDFGDGIRDLGDGRKFAVRTHFALHRFVSMMGRVLILQGTADLSKCADQLDWLVPGSLQPEPLLDSIQDSAAWDKMQVGCLLSLAACCSSIATAENCYTRVLDILLLRAQDRGVREMLSSMYRDKERALGHLLKNKTLTNDQRLTFTETREELLSKRLEVVRKLRQQKNIGSVGNELGSIRAQLAEMYVQRKQELSDKLNHCQTTGELDAITFQQLSTRIREDGLLRRMKPTRNSSIVHQVQLEGATLPADYRCRLNEML